MNGFITYWTKDYIKQLEKHGDKGPYCVIFGSRHTVMPAISSVKVGDIVYPVTIKDRTLCVLARLPVERIEPAFDYLMRETGRHHNSLIPEGVLLQSVGSKGQYNEFCGGSGYTGKVELPDNIRTVIHEEELTDIPHKFHQEPMTCCAKTAASGTGGTMIEEHIIPIEDVRTFLFGQTKSKLQPLHFSKDGGLHPTGLSNLTRKMSPETFAYFENIFK